MPWLTIPAGVSRRKLVFEREPTTTAHHIVGHGSPWFSAPSKPQVGAPNRVPKIRALPRPPLARAAAPPSGRRVERVLEAEVREQGPLASART